MPQIPSDVNSLARCFKIYLMDGCDDPVRHGMKLRMANMIILFEIHLHLKFGICILMLSIIAPVYANNCCANTVYTFRTI